MEMVHRIDPYYEQMKELEESETPPPGRSLPQAMDSPHIWRALLPANLEVGQYLIEMRETDMWGRVHTGRRSVRIE